MVLSVPCPMALNSGDLLEAAAVSPGQCGTISITAISVFEALVPVGFASK